MRVITEHVHVTQFATLVDITGFGKV